MSAILLIDPKYPHNVGQVVRAASCFGIEKVYVWGDRVQLEGDKVKGYRLPREERMRGRYKVDIVKSDKPFDAEPDLRPVAIELVPNALSLPFYSHDPQGKSGLLYVFGPEDGSLPSSVLRHCYDFVSLPMAHCANLAAAVYIVLYDQHCRAVLAGEELPIGLDVSV